MKRRYMLRLLPDGDIDIIEIENNFSIRRVYYKTYNPDNTIEENLTIAYKKWEEFDRWKLSI